MMRPFIMDSPTQERIQKIKEYAESNPISYESIKEMSENPDIIPKDIDEYRVYVQMGYCFVFTIEGQKIEDKIVMIRHLSGNIPEAPGRIPHPVVMKEMMGHLGFKKDLPDCMVQFSHNKTTINIIEVID